MLWPDDVTDEQLALAAAKCDEDEQTREGNENESFGFQISPYSVLVMSFRYFLTASFSKHGPWNDYL